MHKILLIEDDQILQKMYQNKFQFMDYQILTASDGAEGYELAKKELPDFILLDLMMPKTGGIDSLNILKKDPTTSQIPVAILSVIPEEDMKEGGNQDIFNDIIAYWRKDLSNPSEIVLKVKEYLDKEPNKQ